jgi:hypothetical protein
LSRQPGFPRKWGPCKGACRPSALPRQPARAPTATDESEACKVASGVEPHRAGMGVHVDAEGHCPSRVNTYASSAVMLASTSGMPGAPSGCENGRMRPFRIASATARPRELSPRCSIVSQLGPGRRPAYRNRLQHLPKLTLHSRLLDTLAARPSPSGRRCQTGPSIWQSAPRSAAAPPPSVTHTRSTNSCRRSAKTRQRRFASTRPLKRRFSRPGVICVDHAASRSAAIKQGATGNLN